MLSANRSCNLLRAPLEVLQGLYAPGWGKSVQSLRVLNYVQRTLAKRFRVLLGFRSAPPREDTKGFLVGTFWLVVFFFNVLKAQSLQAGKGKLLSLTLPMYRKSWILP